MKSHIEVNCFNDGNLNYLNRLKTEPEDFLNFNAQNLLNIMKEKNSDTAFYSFSNPTDKSSTLLFLVSKNSEIIDELKMKTPTENRTQPLFSEEDLPTNSTFKSLISTLSIDQTHTDFFLEDSGTKYSFKIAYGGKANSLLSNLNRFLDELDMFKEVAEKMSQNNPLDNIKKITAHTHLQATQDSGNKLKI